MIHDLFSNFLNVYLDSFCLASFWNWRDQKRQKCSQKENKWTNWIIANGKWKMKKYPKLSQILPQKSQFQRETKSL